MTKSIVVADQRRYKRYKTRQDSFVAFNSGSLQLGRIINIGKGGLAFFYVETQKPINASSKMDIFWANDGFCLAKIPFKIVSDIYLNGKISDHSIKLRQCGVEFEQLTHFQGSTIDYFIGNYTSKQILISTG
ncbi:MAG TPA: PilZ domain-containing protein [Flavobacteriaceae bacterium]|nr:PilZ domain-containing protein [Flavobacteriaceae bacterium]